MTIEQTIIQIILYIFAAIAILGGTLQLYLGQPQTTQRLDNVHRFMAGIYLSTGIICLWAAITIEEQTTLIYLIALSAFIGGLGRLISIIKVGLPKPSVVWICYLIPELIFPVVIFILKFHSHFF